jgi:TfoX/Sxy family transcriptional regulator of competence genes
MAFNEKLNNRIREALAEISGVEEKKMFGGVCYMVDEKMCMGVMGDEVMCRIGPDAYEDALEKHGCREMVFSGKPLKGYVLVDETACGSKKQLEYWVGLCLAFNKLARPSKKKKK